MLASSDAESVLAVKLLVAASRPPLVRPSASTDVTEVRLIGVSDVASSERPAALSPVVDAPFEIADVPSSTADVSPRASLVPSRSAVVTLAADTVTIVVSTIAVSEFCGIAGVVAAPDPVSSPEPERAGAPWLVPTGPNVSRVLAGVVGGSDSGPCAERAVAVVLSSTADVSPRPSFVSPSSAVVPAGCAEASVVSASVPERCPEPVSVV